MKAVILSDIHAHTWSLFGHTNPGGVNSRLQIIIDEFKRAVDVGVSNGSNTLVVAGDVFHARGAIDPEVLNPMREAFEYALNSNFDVLVLPGNHDLKSDDTRALSSAVQNLAQQDISGKTVEVINKAQFVHFDDGTVFGFVPWRHNHEALLADLSELSKASEAKDAHVFIHAGIDGVLSGIPGSGLTPQKLTEFGFKGIYAGHYHHHIDMSVNQTNRVMSIGATTHQNWGDIGTNAGFLILDTTENTVTFNDTRAPKFIDISGMSEEDMELEVGGNYARFRGPQMTQDQINEFRAALKSWGALGTSIEVPRAVTHVRPTAPSTGLTLDQSVGKFVEDIKELPEGVKKEDVAKRALEVLNETRAIATEA